jgi:hypothetical protein
LAGVLISLLVLAGALLHFIHRFESCPRAASSTGSERRNRQSPGIAHASARADLDAAETLRRLRDRKRQYREIEERP